MAARQPTSLAGLAADASQEQRAALPQLGREAQRAAIEAWAERQGVRVVGPLPRMLGVHWTRDAAGTTPVLWDERGLPQDSPERTWQLVAQVEDRQQGWALQKLLERRLGAEQTAG